MDSAESGCTESFVWGSVIFAITTVHPKLFYLFTRIGSLEVFITAKQFCQVLTGSTWYQYQKAIDWAVSLDMVMGYDYLAFLITGL